MVKPTLNSRSSIIWLFSVLTLSLLNISLPPLVCSSGSAEEEQKRQLLRVPHDLDMLFSPFLNSSILLKPLHPGEWDLQITPYKLHYSNAEPKLGFLNTPMPAAKLKGYAGAVNLSRGIIPIDGGGNAQITGISVSVIGLQVSGTESQDFLENGQLRSGDQKGYSYLGTASIVTEQPLYGLKTYGVTGVGYQYSSSVVDSKSAGMKMEARGSNVGAYAGMALSMPLRSLYVSPFFLIFLGFNPPIATLTTYNPVSKQVLSKVPYKVFKPNLSFTSAWGFRLLYEPWGLKYSYAVRFGVTSHILTKTFSFGLKKKP